MRNKHEKALRPVRPNAGLALSYQRRLERLVDAMHADVEAKLASVYQHRAVMGMDESPLSALRRMIKWLGRKWTRRVNDAAPRLAKYYAQDITRRSDTALRRILKDAGFAIEFKMGRAAQEIIQASVHANVALIKSIPAQYLEKVEIMVMQSVQAGRKLDDLSANLRRQYSLSKKRAALIARDQNNKATAAINRARQVELGITECIWMHSGAGREPRPTHVAAGRQQIRYDPRTGWFDPHERKFILPGELINCRCTSRPVLKSLESR